MPRIRTIKPQFWLDENLGDIPRDARLLYIGLWNLSDDTGVFKWRPLQIKAQIFPYDADIDSNDIENWLNFLVGTKDIKIIESNSKKYGRIKSFLEHQDIKNPSKWTYLEGKCPTPVLPQSYPSPTEALPLGKKEKKKVIGKKENNIPNFIDKDTWNDFLEMRSKSRKAPTDKAKELLIKDLEKLRADGFDPNEVLKQSIKNNWAGVFPLKNNNNPPRQSTAREGVECEY